MTLIRVLVALAGVGIGLWVIVFNPRAETGPTSAELAREAAASDRAAAADSAARTTARAAGHAEPWLDEDWAIFESTVRAAAQAGLDTVPFGDAIVAIGRTFVGTAYEPGTLEAPGPEHVVINFRGLDCVTFVENALALARFVRGGGVDLLPDRPTAEARYRDLLERVRYRDGELEGYASRLHYFSEWIADNTRRGLLEDVSAELGAVPDEEPLDFMTAHPDAYRQLADPAVRRQIAETERYLSARPRMYVPEARIAEVADRIRDGDVIAATSTLPGLDVAHTGLAVRVDGALHLLHAPLVGDSVEISEVPLAERILRIEAQDGIMVARPRGG